MIDAVASFRYCTRGALRCLSSTWRVRFVTRLLSGIVAVLGVAMPVSLMARDLVDLPLEQLLETGSLISPGFAREVTDAPSAVSVVTADEIRMFGYRNLAEILDSMRGVFVGYDGEYFHLVGRGLGMPSSYAGRVLVLIDGHPVPDGMYNQTLFGDDQLVDVALIERVEYAPGPGAAMYGNNAFLGVVNVITKRGRDLDGGQLALLGGSGRQRSVRLSWGAVDHGGTEWLLSGTVHGRDLSSPAVNAVHEGSSSDGRVFFKARRGALSFEGAVARRRQAEELEVIDMFGQLARSKRVHDESAFAMLRHDGELGAWRSMLKLYYGQYAYRQRYKLDLIDPGLYFGGASSVFSNWWGWEAQLASVVLGRHRVVLGAEYRSDSRQRRRDAYWERTSGFSDASRRHASERTVSLYVQDEVMLHPGLSLNLGVRHDRRTDQGSTAMTNQRAALIYDDAEGLVVKLSHGRAGRFLSRDENWWPAYEGRPRTERVDTTELALDRRFGNLQLLASAYRYEITEINTWNSAARVHGVELEAGWRARGVVLEGSVAYQETRDEFDRWHLNSPRVLGKLRLSVPVDGDRLRASVGVRGVGKRLAMDGTEVGGYGVVDLTISSVNAIPGVNATFAVRNLFDRRYGDVSTDWMVDGLTIRGGRTAWLQLEFPLQ